MDKIEFSNSTWMDIEKRLKKDIRIIIPLGATEEHAHLSLSTDTLFVEKVTHEACKYANVLLAPVMPFGCSAFAINFPGTISMRTKTLCYVVEDIVDCLYRQGFRRIIFVTGHGGNEVITGVLSELQLDRPKLCIYYKDAWQGMGKSIRELEQKYNLPVSEHAAWPEDFSFTRINEIPDLQKSFSESIDFPSFPLNPRTARKYLAEGVVSGKFTLQHEITQSLLQDCINSLTEFLLTIPKESPKD